MLLPCLMGPFKPIPRATCDLIHHLVSMSLVRGGDVEGLHVSWPW